MEHPEKILVLDDHELIVEGICTIIRTVFPSSHITTFSKGADAIQEIGRNRYDIFVMDIELQDMKTFDIITIIRKKHPASHIIINTMHEEVWFMKKLLSMDVDGIILKSSPTNQFRQALRTVWEGNKYYCQRFNYLRKEKDVDMNISLTRRESQVLQFIVKGMTTKEIAEAIGRTENTVETFRKNLFEKLGAKNATHLTAIAFERGLVQNS